jgi:hypothetical protein
MATPHASARTLRAFVSYAHVDHAPFGELQTYLKSIERAYDVVFWADRRMTAGNYWTDRIAREIEGSDIHLLLMSPAFFASDYIFEKELPAIDERCGAGALVIPILIKPCFWSPFVGVIQAVPMTLRGELLAITEWKPKHNGYNAVANQVAAAIGEQFNRKPKSPFAWNSP